MGNMVVIALVLDERRKEKERLKAKEERNNFAKPLLEPLLGASPRNKCSNSLF